MAEVVVMSMDYGPEKMALDPLTFAGRCLSTEQRTTGCLDHIRPLWFLTCILTQITLQDHKAHQIAARVTISNLFHSN